MKTISPAALQSLLVAQPALSLIDVRTPVEFAEVHVPQARNLPLDELNPRAFAAENLRAPDRPVYIICSTENRAAKAAEALAKAGFPRAVVVEGGTLAWIEAGFPVSRGQARIISLERQVRIAAGSLVLTSVVLGWWVHPGFLGLAAFVGAGLVFAGITDYCGMGLLLAKLPWNTRRPAWPGNPATAR